MLTSSENTLKQESPCSSCGAYVKETIHEEITAFLHTNWIYPYKKEYPNDDLALYSEYKQGAYPLEDTKKYFKRKYYEKIKSQGVGINLSIPQMHFFKSKAKYRSFTAGLGCVHPTTKIVTEHGLMRICDITKPTRVLSWNEKSQKFQLSLSGGSFPKGRANLHRVQSSQGEFLSTAHHQIFSSGHTYEHVSDMHLCPSLSVSLPLFDSNEELVQKLSSLDAVRYSKTVEDYQGGCAYEARLHGQRLLTEEEVDLVYAPSPDDAPSLSRNDGLLPPFNKTETVLKVSDAEVDSVYYDMQVLDTHNYVCEGGFIHHNSGKSYMLAVAVVAELFRQKHADVHLYVFSISLDTLKQTVVKEVEKLLEPMGYEDILNKSAMSMTIPNYGRIFFKTMADPDSIVGFEAHSCWIDELDVMALHHAQTAWNKICARARQKIEVPSNHPIYADDLLTYSDEFDPQIRYRRNTVNCFSSPEGFRFLYKQFYKEKRDQHELIQAPSYSNCFLPDGYIEGMVANFPPELADAYVRGNFVNLNALVAYYGFKRANNVIPSFVPHPSKELYVGMDFNINHMSATVAIMEGGVLKVFDNLVGLLDTPTTIRVIKEKYPSSKITVFPDASGGGRKTTDASKTDISLLYQAGFAVVAPKKNGSVKVRWDTVNIQLNKQKVLITEHCQQLIEDLEQQTVDERTQAPDKKGGNDHNTDALGYLVIGLMPVELSRVHVTNVVGL